MNTCSRKKGFDSLTKKMESSEEMSLNELPEGCIANVLSFTTPVDVGRLSAVSPMFKSASVSDVAWERFLPSDLESILSTSPDGSLLLASGSSKKQLYFRLCDNPVLVDNGRKRFSLDKKSGKKCYMLSARDLRITWGGTPEYWTWNSNPASRFEEVAELIGVQLLDIFAKISTCLLSPATLYTANLVFKFSMEEAYGFDNQPVDVTMILGDVECGARTVSWNAESRLSRNRAFRTSVIIRGSVHYPKKRGDGWLEMEIGDFFSKEGEDGELEMRLFDNSQHWKCGLIVEGIEIRPKDDRTASSPSNLRAFLESTVLDFHSLDHVSMFLGLLNLELSQGIVGPLKDALLSLQGPLTQLQAHLAQQGSGSASHSSPADTMQSPSLYAQSFRVLNEIKNLETRVAALREEQQRDEVSLVEHTIYDKKDELLQLKRAIGSTQSHMDEQGLVSLVDFLMHLYNM